MQALRFALILLPLVLPAACLCRLAHRAAIGLVWRAIACVLLSAIAAFIYSQVDSPSLTGRGRMLIAFQAPHTPLQGLQVCIPLVLLVWSYRRTWHARPPQLGVT